jgi:predicted HTH domain antitoxin
MQITINLPDNLTQTDTFHESDWMREIAIALFQNAHITLEQGAQLAGIPQPQFQQLLISREITISPVINEDPDDEPEELILESLRTSLQQIREGRVHPISELWDGIDV